MDGGEPIKNEVFPRLLIQRGITRGPLEEAITHRSVLIHGYPELRGLRRFVTGSREFHFRALDGADRFQFRRQPRDCRRGPCYQLDWRRQRPDWGRWLRARHGWIGRGWRHVFQCGLPHQVRRRVLHRGHCEGFSVRGRLRGRGERRILGLQPIQENAPFLGIRCNHSHAPRRRQESDRRRIDNLKRIETQGVQHKGRAQKTGEGQSPRTWLVPGKDEAQIALGSQRSAHFAGVVASATEEIPCSRARFVTSTTSV
jgi:hypothetical protein